MSDKEEYDIGGIVLRAEKGYPLVYLSFDDHEHIFCQKLRFFFYFYLGLPHPYPTGLSPHAAP